MCHRQPQMEINANAVMTVLGAVPASELGFCQCHEHLAIRKGVSFEKNPALCIDELSRSTEEAKRTFAAGTRTIVDAQPGGCCRMEDFLVKISRESGLHIIASTGFHKLCFYPRNHWLYTKSQEELCEIFTHELTAGMYTHIDTAFHPETCSVRAGIVKMALDKEGLTPLYRKLFAAGTKAAVRADVPIMVHIEQGSDPLKLFDCLTGLGALPSRMIFCHMDRAVSDLDIHKRLLGKGVYLEYDTIGRFRYHSDAEEIAIFQAMIEAGYEDRLLFSLDTTRTRLKAYTPHAVGLDYLHTTFLPLMKEHGITPEQLRKISNQNFVRVFTPVKQEN